MTTRRRINRLFLVAFLAASGAAMFAARFSRTTTADVVPPQCGDGVDNDGDGIIDWNDVVSSTVAVPAVRPKPSSGKPVTPDVVFDVGTSLLSVSVADGTWCPRHCGMCSGTCVPAEENRCKTGDGVVDGCAQPLQACSKIRGIYIGSDGKQLGTVMTPDSIGGLIPAGAVGVYFFVEDTRRDDNAGECDVAVAFAATDPDCYGPTDPLEGNASSAACGASLGCMSAAQCGASGGTYGQYCELTPGIADSGVVCTSTVSCPSSVRSTTSSGVSSRSSTNAVSSSPMTCPMRACIGGGPCAAGELCETLAEPPCTRCVPATSSSPYGDCQEAACFRSVAECTSAGGTLGTTTCVYSPGSDIAGVRCHFGCPSSSSPQSVSSACNRLHCARSVAECTSAGGTLGTTTCVYSPGSDIAGVECVMACPAGSSTSSVTTASTSSLSSIPFSSRSSSASSAGPLSTPSSSVSSRQSASAAATSTAHSIGIVASSRRSSANPPPISSRTPVLILATISSKAETRSSRTASSSADRCPGSRCRAHGAVCTLLDRTCVDIDTIPCMACVAEADLPVAPVQCHGNECGVTSRCGATETCVQIPIAPCVACVPRACRLHTECMDGGRCVEGLCLPAGIPACGDGVLDAGEACDDGNRKNGDACGDTCLFPRGGSCSDDAQCATGLCWDGRCDGCVVDAECDPGKRCIEGGCVRTTMACGNGRLDVGEQCDDGGNRNGDGCGADCNREVGQACDRPTSCESGVCREGRCVACRTDDQCGDGARCVLGACRAPDAAKDIPNACGNGIVDGNEQCDGGTDCTSACVRRVAERRTEVASNVVIQLPFTAMLEEQRDPLRVEKPSESFPRTTRTQSFDMVGETHAAARLPASGPAWGIAAVVAAGMTWALGRKRRQ